MFYSGISDEAGPAIDDQIRAHNELGWEYMELRMVDGTNVTQLDDDSFDRVCDALAAAGKKVSCLGSAIGNWARPITSDLQVDIDDLNRSIERMQRLEIPFIRVMSYPNDESNPISESEWRTEAISRMKQLAKIAEDGGVVLCHENCSGWGGLSSENSNILLGEVNSPALRLVFDTGNPVSYCQDAWDYYQAVVNDIAYVHVKDAQIVNDEDVYVYCGEGEGNVQRILADLLGRGYDGGISIEPHLEAVIHTGQKADSAESLYQSYVEYGKRLMNIVEPILANQQQV